MSFLSLKEVLAGWLEASLFSICEDNPIHFMLSLHKPRIQTPFSRKISLRQPIHWRNIPISKKPTSGTILYTSALPHIVAREAFELENITLAEISEQLVDQLNQNRFGRLNSDLDHEGDLLLFVRQLWSEFKIETRRPGWLALHLSNRGIELWIEHHQKVFQTNHKHTQLFLHYGCLSQMSYPLFKSVDYTDRDHRNPAFKLSNQHHNQGSFTDNLRDSFKRSLSENNVSTQGSLSPQLADNAPSRQRAGTQLIRPELTTHRHLPRTKHPPQQALRPNQSQLAENWLWQVQYTYARCCSVIQRWEAITGAASQATLLQTPFAPEAFTTQSSKPAVSIDTSLKEPSQPVPHTQPHTQPKRRDHPASDPRLAHEHPDQQLIVQQLITSLIEVTDNLFWIPYRWPSQQYFLLLKSSSHLCRAFETFSSQCLVGFGQVAQGEVPRDRLRESASHYAHFQTQVDLVVATQNILKVLLEAYLEAPAPTEL